MKILEDCRSAMSNYEEKQTLLLRLYEVFETYAEQNLRMACVKGCALCCTQNVTLTSLEAALILNELKRSGQDRVLHFLNKNRGADRFRPHYTTNDLARYCLNQQEPPEEEPGLSQTPCPLLKDDICPVYNVRPLACRGFFSLTACRPGGQADIPPELVEIVTACQQIIEHIDASGYFGNLTDVLILLNHGNNLNQYMTGDNLPSPDLPVTKPLPGFLIHPDQREKVVPFLSRLLAGDCGGQSFKKWMERLRQP